MEESIHYALQDGQSDIDDGPTYATDLVTAYAQNLTNMSMIQRALFNTFKIRFRLGLFDPPQAQPWRHLGVTSISDASARAANAEALARSHVPWHSSMKRFPGLAGGASVSRFAPEPQQHPSIALPGQGP